MLTGDARAPRARRRKGAARLRAPSHLRRKAAGQLGTEGVEGARALADAIEDVLVGRSDELIPVEGLALEAAYCVLDVSMHWGMSNPTAYPLDVVFFRAIIELQKQQAVGG